VVVGFVILKENEIEIGSKMSQSRPLLQQEKPKRINQQDDNMN
jgi:hypothetical protein